MLWIPANHNILGCRLFIWAFITIGSSKEYYEFISNKHCKRVGSFVWLPCLTLGVEFSIAIKFGSTMFHAPFPWYVQVMWMIIGGLILFGAMLAYMNESKKNKEIDSVEVAFDPQEPSIDIEPVFATKKNN
jgi:hypothetical protein